MTWMGDPSRTGRAAGPGAGPGGGPEAGREVLAGPASGPGPGTGPEGRGPDGHARDGCTAVPAGPAFGCGPGVGPEGGGPDGSTAIRTGISSGHGPGPGPGHGHRPDDRAAVPARAASGPARGGPHPPAPRPPGLDRRLLHVLRDAGGRAGVGGAARGLSFAGEHGAVWLAAGLLAAAVDRPRRAGWLRGTALVGGAHLVSMGVKRAVRRARPPAGEFAPLVRTAGRHSFPSSHASSAAAAAVAFATLHPPVRRVVVPAAAAMCVSRLVVGVHYPTDVAVGALLGAATATAGRRWLTGGPVA